MDFSRQVDEGGSLSESESGGGSKSASEGGGQSASESGRWFWTTAAYGGVFGSLYAATGHRLIAPIVAHASLNIGMCMRDWRRMRRTPLPILQRMFAQTERSGGGESSAVR